jgi:apolipoprotein N-acyltransferase
MIHRLSALRDRNRFLLSLLLGGLSAIGFAPLGAWPALLACLIGLMLLVRTAPTRGGALLSGWAFGWAQFSVGLFWMAHAFTYQDAMPEFYGWFASPLLSVYLALYPAMAAGLAWRWGRHDKVKFTLFFAASWIVTEWLRGTVFTGFPWNPLSVAFVDMAAAATTLGTYGVSGLVVMACGAATPILARQWRAAAALCALPACALLANLGTVPGPDDRPVTMRLHIVQPNIGQQDKYRAGYEAENWAKLERLTRAGKTGIPRLILWPEAAVPDKLGENDPAAQAARARIAAMMHPRDIILAGADTIYAQTVTHRFFREVKWVGAANSVFTLDATGKVIDRYDKAHLVPFGEYLPMRPLLVPLGLSRLVPGTLDFWPGPGPHSQAIPGLGKIGTQICYEIIFSGQVADRANRPDFIFNPSNEAWFGSWASPQFLAQARMRAIEEGLPVIRSTPTGTSAVISAYGRVLSALPVGRPGYIQANLPPSRPAPFFARHGNIIPLGFAALLLLIGIALRRRVG